MLELNFFTIFQMDVPTPVLLGVGGSGTGVGSVTLRFCWDSLNSDLVLVNLDGNGSFSGVAGMSFGQVFENLPLSNSC